MNRTRFTDEQIIGILGEHEAGAKCADLCRKHGMSEGTFYNWKAKFGGMTVSDVDCHRELTRQLQKLSLRIDPCVTLPLLESAGSYWSVRHGISEDYSEMGSARQDAHPRDCAPDRGVSQHDQEVSADRDS
jgi:putative transposase